MKRDDALASLSRDHHQALFRALKLKRADADTAAEALAEMIDFFDSHGAHHFRVEEDVLLPAFARHGDAAAPEVVRVLTDHVEIRRRAEDLEAATPRTTQELGDLGEILNEHVRHEERVLFPLIERSLPAAELEALAQRIEEAESSG